MGLDHSYGVRYETVELFSDSSLDGQLLPEEELLTTGIWRPSLLSRWVLAMEDEKMRCEGEAFRVGWVLFFLKSRIRIPSLCAIFCFCCRMFNRNICGHINISI